MLRLLVRHADFRRLWLAGAISLLGDWLGFVAVSLLALEQGGGPIALATIFAAHSLPRALLSPIAGVIVDRFDRRAVLVGANAVEALLTFAIAGAAARGAIAFLQLLVVVRSAVAAFVVPAESATLPRVVPEKALLPANALLSATWSVAYVVGMALGGAIATLGPVLALCLDALSFVLAAIVVATLPAMRADGERRTLGAVLRTVPQDLSHALRHAWSDRALFRAVFAKAPLALAGGGGFIALNLVAGEAPAFGSAALSLGVLQALRGAGTGLGPLVATVLARRGSRDGLLVTASVVTTLVALAAFVPSTAFVGVPFVVAVVWGMGVGSNWVLSSATIQRRSPDGMTGRLSAIDELAWTVAMVVGAYAGGAVGTAARATSVGLVAGAIAWVILVRATRVTSASAGPSRC